MDLIEKKKLNASYFLVLCGKCPTHLPCFRSQCKLDTKYQ